MTAPGIAVLADIREEHFAQLVAKGVQPKDARAQAGYSKTGKWSVKKLMNEPRIRARIDCILERAADRAVMSKADIITEVTNEWRLARQAGQHTASLRAAEMLGSELYNMFSKKVEVGRPGEFDDMDETQLRQFIENKMRELGMLPPPDKDTIIIEQKPNKD